MKRKLTDKLQESKQEERPDSPSVELPIFVEAQEKQSNSDLIEGSTCGKSTQDQSSTSRLMTLSSGDGKRSNLQVFADCFFTLEEGNKTLPRTYTDETLLEESDKVVVKLNQIDTKETTSPTGHITCDIRTKHAMLLPHKIIVDEKAKKKKAKAKQTLCRKSFAQINQYKRGHPYQIKPIKNL